MNGMYEELIEKLRKNNRMSGWTHIDGLIDEAAEAIEALQQENEQLRAQAARMREVLEQFKYDYEQNYPIYQNYLAVCQLLREDTVQAYHNPDDVEALRKAREALCKGISELKVHCKYFDNTPEEDACIEMHETVLEIDKILGGMDK